MNCSDRNQPGVSSILSVLWKKSVKNNCVKDSYHLVNNYDTPYHAEGTLKPLGADKFVYPPQYLPTIGEASSAKNVSWKWYTAGRDTYDFLGDTLYPVVRYQIIAQVPGDAPEPVWTQIVDAGTYAAMQTIVYNRICDPHNASTKVVNTPKLCEHLKRMQPFLTT